MMTLKNLLLASLVLGGVTFANKALQGQARVPAYVITEIEVTDAEAFKEYAPQVQASFVPFGGRYVVRGGKTQSFAGDAPKRVVVLAFDSIDQARAWYDSPQYEALKGLRDKAGKARIFVVEGLTPQLDPEHAAGISVRGRVSVSEEEVSDDALEDRIVSWPKRAKERR